MKSGIGRTTVEMPKNDGMDDWERLSGLRLITGTLNLQFSEAFDVSLLNYLVFAEIGWGFDPPSQGHAFRSETGMHYHRVTISGRYPGVLIFWTWSSKPEGFIHVELVSIGHPRTALGLCDGDAVGFTLYHSQWQ